MAAVDIAVPRRSIPEQSPIDGGTVICGGCGNPLVMTVKMGRRGVEVLRYECNNEERGCSYFFETRVYVSAEMKGIRKDGTMVTVPEARV